ncbi:MAG: LysR substrate-binding domain-containing protein, partial [Photobacterium frigidiphilum]|uniref:LysR substrate-binding domain-containing protein n=1 Tax=Photobacterium frigidiphilum TaxID=264736 RepID=UPI003001D8CE
LGHGITALPDWMVEAFLLNGKLIRVLANYHSISLPMYAVYKADDYQPYRVRAFIDFLADYFYQSQEAV